MKFVRLLWVAFLFYGVLSQASVSAAPIGIPGATSGVNQSTVGVELNFLVDRDLDGPGDTEGMHVLAKGQVGVSERIDFLYRLGLGRFESGGNDSDAGPAFGFGTKVTWATVESINLKIGSVAQMLQVRADVDGGGRQAFKEYDFALGAFLDAASSGNRSILTSYAGVAFSGVEITGGTRNRLENNAVGLFAGLVMNMNQKTQVGLELRLADQTALSVFTSFAF